MMTLTVLRSPGQGFCRFHWDLSDVFLMFRWGDGYWGRRPQTKSAIFITSHQRHILLSGLPDVDLDYLAEAAFVRFLHCKVTLFHTVLSGEHSPHPLLLGSVCLITHYWLLPTCLARCWGPGIWTYIRRGLCSQGISGLEERRLAAAGRCGKCMRSFPGSTEEVPARQALLLYVLVL